MAGLLAMTVNPAKVRVQRCGVDNCDDCDQSRDLDDVRARSTLVQRTVHAAVQRDAAAMGRVRDAVSRPDSEATGRGYQEAFHILNGLAMFDMLSTLTALRRSGQFEKLNANFKWATGVSVPRLQVAFEAVQSKGSVTADAFVLRHKDVLQSLPVEQRQDIINYLDPQWFDELKANEDAEALITAIRSTLAFKALGAASVALTEEIITESRKTPTKLVDYMTKLKDLFDTKVKSPDEISTETKENTRKAVSAEQKRVANPAEAKKAQLEEKASGDRKRNWVPIPGKFGGGVYYVDKTSPANIVIKARVFLKPAGKSDAKYVASIKKMEDGIEKAASTKGYLVDVIFVTTPAVDELGNPPFTADVDHGKWETATNWSGGDPLGFAHELHHMFAFTLDRYNYIEAHSRNESMTIENRLYWFRKELSKPASYNDPTSIMSGAAHPNDDDVCRVAGLDPPSCVALRQKATAP